MVLLPLAPHPQGEREAMALHQLEVMVVAVIGAIATEVREDMMVVVTEVVKTEEVEKTVAEMTEDVMTVVMEVVVVVGPEGAMEDSTVAAEVVLIKVDTTEDPAVEAAGIEDQDGMTSLSRKIPSSSLECHLL